MFMDFFILSFLSLWTLSYQSYEFPSKDNNLDDHLIDLMDHLRLQNGWKNLAHINLLLNSSTININHVTESDVTVVNVRPRFQQLTLFFNYRYTEILLKIQEIIEFIISQCQERLTCRFLFIDCVKHLRGTIADSVEMFKRLYDSMYFLKKLYSSITTYISVSEPEIINGILLLLKSFAEGKCTLIPLEKNNFLNAQSEFASIVRFFRSDISKRLDNLFQRNSIFYRISNTAVDVLTSYGLQQPKSYPGFNACKIREILSEFYYHVAKSHYENFGFDHLIHLQFLG